MKRDATIDIMKGLGLLLVVLGHTYNDSQVIYSFHMPLFFILSGASMSFSTHGFSLARRFKAIIVPYFCFSLLSFIYWLLIESHFRPFDNTPLFEGVLGTFDLRWQQFINIFLAENTVNSFAYNVVLWFLPCLFVADCLYSRMKFTPPQWKWTIVLVLPAIYYILIAELPCLPLCLNIAILAVPFLALGHQFYGIVNNYISHGYNIIRCVTLSIILLVTFIIAYRYFCPSINMLANKVSPFYLFYGFAIIGSLLVLCISNLMTKTKRICEPFCWIGRNSLVIMCIHEPLKRIILFILSKMLCLPVDVMRDNLCFSIITTVIVVLVCVPFIIFINRYCPIMLGRCRNTN